MEERRESWLKELVASAGIQCGCSVAALVVGIIVAVGIALLVANCVSDETGEVTKCQDLYDFLIDVDEPFVDEDGNVLEVRVLEISSDQSEHRFTEDDLGKAICRGVAQTTEGPHEVLCYYEESDRPGVADGWCEIEPLEQ